MSKENTKQPFTVDLLLVCAEVTPQKDGMSSVRFGAKSAEEILTKMCKEDPESWKIVKSVVNDVFNKIEAAAEKE